MRSYSSKSDKWFRNKSHSKVGNYEADVSKKFQSYPSKPLRHVNFAELLANV